MRLCAPLAVLALTTRAPSRPISRGGHWLTAPKLLLLQASTVTVPATAATEHLKDLSWTAVPATMPGDVPAQRLLLRDCSAPVRSDMAYRACVCSRVRVGVPSACVRREYKRGRECYSVHECVGARGRVGACVRACVCTRTVRSVCARECTNLRKSTPSCKD